MMLQTIGYTPFRFDYTGGSIMKRGKTGVHRYVRTDACRQVSHMLFDVRKGNTVNPYITIAAALKNESENFANEIEAIRFVRDNNVKPYLVDPKMTEYYLASDLGVYFNKDEETKSK